MNPNAVTLPTQETAKRTYDVLIEQKDEEVLQDIQQHRQNEDTEKAGE